MNKTTWGKSCIAGVLLFTLGAYAGEITIGTGTTAWAYPFFTSYHDARTQIIYFASEIGGAKMFNSLALDVTTIPGQTMNNYTIRLKHTGLSSYDPNSQWESSGWTTVYQANQTIATTGWVTFPFTAEFAYNGTQNLMVDISFNNSSYSSNGFCRYTTSGVNRSLYAVSNSGYGDPLTWSSRTPTPSVMTVFSNIKLGFGVGNIVFNPDGGVYNTEKNVAIICPTSGATIHYTTNGLDPTESDPIIASGSSVYIDQSLTLKARAWKEGLDPSSIKSATYQLVVSDPNFALGGGTYNTEKTVMVTCATAGAEIHYTVSSDPNIVIVPTESDPVIASGSSITVDRTMTIRAKAWKESMTPSGIKSATYQLVVSDPNLAPGGGTYNTEKTVVVTCATAGAEIHYTVSSNPNIVIVPTESDPVIASGSSITVDRTMTIRAKAWKGSMTPSGIKSATYTVVVSTPAFSVVGGTYDIEKNVVITCATSGATIHYTTNGIDPTESDPVIASGSSVYVDHTLALKAKAWKGNMTPSIIRSATYQFVVVRPIFSKNDGTYNIEQTVTITCATSGVTIHYTTNGIDPTESDPVIASGSSVYVDHTLTLKAKAWKDGFDPSSVKSATYQIVVATPVFTPTGGTYNSEQNVVIACTTSGAAIHYTTNGVNPTESDPVIASGSSVTVDHTMTLKARAWKGNMTPSSVRSATYQIVVVTPEFTPTGGTYNNEQNVVITCTASGATIHYTTNGIEPTESDPVIASGSSVTVDHTMTLKARAWKDNMTPSSVRSATYQIVVGTPVFTPDGGTYNTEQNVIITCATSGATIRYTLDGSDPNGGIEIASGDSVLVNHSLTLKSVAWKNSDCSGVTSATYQIVVATPVFTPDGGGYDTDQTVVITCATPGAEIHYTLSNEPNNIPDPQFGNPIIASGGSVTVSVSPPTYLKARAWKAGFETSEVKTAFYHDPEFKYGGGSGTSEDPYQIWISQEMNTIGTKPNDWNSCFKLMADINMSAYTGTQYNIIGNSTIPFTGTFDGNDQKITHFTIQCGSKDYLGLFGRTGSDCQIKNLGIEDFSVSGDYYVGGLAGYNDHGSISNCYSTGTVNGNSYTGGLVGYNEGTVTSCHSTSSVSGLNNVGGLVGYNEGTVTSCCATGEVNGSYYYTGGLVGHNTGTVTSCCATGAVSGTSNVGGLVGFNDHHSITISCYATGAVNGTSYVGGLLGAVWIYWGSSDNIIARCYATGAVSGTSYVGGLVGYVVYWFDDAPSNLNYAANSVNEINYAGDGTDCFWDIETSGQTTSSVYGTGKTTAQMITLTTFTSAGWDFTNIWDICEGTNYPRLQWQIPETDWVCPDGVNIEDLDYFVDQWLENDCNSVNNYCGGVDLNTSGKVDITDFAVLADHWLQGYNSMHEPNSCDPNSYMWVPGHTGNALSFDGVNDYVQISGYKGITGQQPRTVSAWIRATNSGQIISWGSMDSGQKWVIRLNNSTGTYPGALRAEISDGRIIGTRNLWDGAWHHIAVTWEPDSTPDIIDAKLYVDGVLETLTETTSLTLNTAATNDVVIGTYLSLPGYFNGAIDDVRIYNRALAASEINPNALPATGLVAHWAMDETTGTVAHDSVSSYDGTLIGY